MTVRVQLPDKSPFDNAVVNLRTFNGIPIGTQTIGQGRASFQDLPGATFSVEVVAPGFENITQSVEIVGAGDQQFITLVLKPLPGTAVSLVHSGPPVLAPGPQKELNKTMEALRGDKADGIA
ncbi:MAG: carboxypeptidase regulatory-like domain-containing protein [Acidobacteria bacterium]|nr:carboxypeptidase regulatory-like domain-containing protein [Acidobacteriota bacterium]